MGFRLLYFWKEIALSEYSNEEITPHQIKPKPIPIKKKSVEGQKSVDEYMTTAKALVLENYTEHQVPRGNPEITLDDLILVWFTKTLSNGNAWSLRSMQTGCTTRSHIMATLMKHTSIFTDVSVTPK